MSSTSSSAAAPRLHPLFLITMALLGIFAFVQVYSVQSILPELQHDLNATTVEIGNAVGATLLAVALAAPFVGMFSDAFGRRWLIITSVFTLAIPTLLLSWVDSVNGLFVLRFLQGLAVPGVTVVTVAYVGEELRGSTMVRTMTMYMSGCILGGFLGRFILGYLSDFFGWRSAFTIMAALNLAGALLIIWGLPRSKNFVANRQFSESLATLGKLLRNPYLQAACALGFTVLFSLVGEFTFVSLHLAEAPYLFNSSQLANVFTVYLLGVIITPLSGRIIPVIGVRQTVLLALGLSVIGLLLTLAQPVWIVIVAISLSACGLFVTQGAIMAFIAHRVTEGRSQASGLYYSVYYSGGFAGAWLCGLAYTWASWNGTVAMLIATHLVGWSLAWRFMPRQTMAAKP
ncbi:MAG TPA: MFS transporter [Burkholderiaceae bacterium]|nr:MFS transporter [Burkholderiaceae bacterium]